MNEDTCPCGVPWSEHSDLTVSEAFDPIWATP